MGISIDLTLSNIWKSWKLFRRGKRVTRELGLFQFHLEENLFGLWKDLAQDTYRHGGYTTYVVFENKKRDIAVAPLRDRVLHRLLYEYLVRIYDRTFIFDVWSCRRGKGLLGAIERSQKFLTNFPRGFVWRSDIKKFFDSVDHEILLKILSYKIHDERAMQILTQIIKSFETPQGNEDGGSASPKGIPIGNLTSQIFSNIYLNAFDQYVIHTLRPNRYLRYGDDFILLMQDKKQLEYVRQKASRYLTDKLKLTINQANDMLCRTTSGAHFLGCNLYPRGRRIKRRVVIKSFANLKRTNISSYWGLFKHHGGNKLMRRFEWQVLEIIEDTLSF